ncbi:MAG: 30S ribosomal protein S5 [Candidatus Paceibacterota bacterium]|jgi:small subunit ribosomal protein S5
MMNKGRGGGNRGKNPLSKPKSEYKEKTVDIRRVARVMAGGKRFTFRCTLVIGDEKGMVGVGIAKGLDVAQAIDKARNDAKKNLFRVKIKGTTLAHEVKAKFSAARVIIKPAKEGSGLKAGGSVRTVLLMAGVKDASAKCLGRTKNKLTNALATIEALKMIRT